MKTNNQQDTLKKPWHSLGIADVEKALDTSISNGLSDQEVQKRLEKYGKNSLPAKKQKHAFIRFVAHFNDILIYILIAAAGLTAYMQHWIDTVVILGVVIINASIGFIQENSAEKSLKAIQNMLSSNATVKRDGGMVDIDTSLIVPGDIVYLKPGAKVPADLRLIDVHNLQLLEAILTGESAVINKDVATLKSELAIGDQLNMAFSGTTVSAGTAYGIAVATGEHTELGHINEMMNDVQEIRTPLLQQMDKLGKNIFFILAGMMVILFLVGYFIRLIPLTELLLSLISLVVASVPEGLPAIISIILSMGVKQMAAKGAIIRKLPTVETLGAVTVICSDKTGTLTMNEMTVKSVILADDSYKVTGESYDPTGEILSEKSDQKAEIQAGGTLFKFLAAVKLCNDATLTKDEQDRWAIVGDPTGGALKVLAVKSKIEIEDNRLNKIPFDSKYKYMSTYNKIGDKYYIFMTGAPDVIFKLCKKQLTKNGTVEFDITFWEKMITQYAKDGLRMLAAAYKETDGADSESFDHEHLKDSMVFIGLAGMMDPPRPEAIEAIKLCQGAGIRVKMITGDHRDTAVSIGAMLNIGTAGCSMTGTELDHMNDAEFAKAAYECDIFARTSPEHKLRLVKALQDRGEVVGMTGDGVNDAPALKQAEVGIAMGIKGTEVTKEAADMILTDDNFSTIASAVQEGRRVYDNLKKTIAFVLPTNLAQGLLIIIAILFAMPLPLSPLQILWVNMTTSTTLSFGLAFEAAEKDSMTRPPRKAGSSILDSFIIWRVIFVGLLIAAGIFMLNIFFTNKGYNPTAVNSILLNSIAMIQITYMINCRKRYDVALDSNILHNRGLWTVIGVLFLLQILIINNPVMNRIFDTTPISLSQWLIGFAVGVVIFIIIEIEKTILKKFAK